MEPFKFKALLKEGLRELYKADGALLESGFDINERTITHRLAYHLTAIFHDYDVDCEYNRMVDHTGHYTEGDYWAKRINIQVEENISGEDTEAKTVFPDVIIHQRRTKVNLAIIEVKISWKNKKKEFDYRKLRAYKKDLHYDYAVYIELSQSNYRCEYVS